MKKLMFLLAMVLLTFNVYTQECPKYSAPRLEVYINGVLATTSDSVTINYSNITAVGYSLITFNKLYNVVNTKIFDCNGYEKINYDYTYVFSKFIFTYYDIRNLHNKQSIYAIRLDYAYNTGFGNVFDLITRIYLVSTNNTPYNNGYIDAKATCNK